MRTISTAFAVLAAVGAVAGLGLVGCGVTWWGLFVYLANTIAFADATASALTDGL